MNSNQNTFKNIHDVIGKMENKKKHQSTQPLTE